MAEPQTLFDLYKRTGEHLAGRRLILRFQPPNIKAEPGRRILGSMSPLSDGRALIDILPGLGAESELETFLHELAHIPLHFGELAARPPAQAMAIYAEPVTTACPPATKTKQESEADTLAAQWLDYAKSHAERSDLESRLWALLKMPLQPKG
jgi:hypothetical protein